LPDELDAHMQPAWQSMIASRIICIESVSTPE